MLVGVQHCVAEMQTLGAAYVMWATSRSRVFCAVALAPQSCSQAKCVRYYSFRLEDM